MKNSNAPMFLLKADVISRRNPVARNLNTFNRADTHRDRKHDYKRKPKYRLNWDTNE
jgi:hypothetical protein